MLRPLARFQIWQRMGIKLHHSGGCTTLPRLLYGKCMNHLNIKVDYQSLELCGSWMMAALCQEFRDDLVFKHRESFQYKDVVLPASEFPLLEKMISWPSHLCNGNPHLYMERQVLYWNKAQVHCLCLCSISIPSGYVSGHGTVAVLLPVFFSIQVTRQPQLHDLTHINTKIDIFVIDKWMVYLDYTCVHIFCIL